LDLLANFTKGIYPPSTWRGLLTLDENLIADSPWNDGARDRGRVTLSAELSSHPGLVVYRQIGGSAEALLDLPQVFKTIRLPEYPDEGFYRLEIPGEWQREFLIDSAWCAPIVIERIKPVLDTSDWFQWKERDLLISPLITSELLALTSGPHPITKREAAGYPIVTFEDAQEFVTEVGGRLPMGEELQFMFEAAGKLESEQVLEGEFVTDIINIWPIEYSARLGYELHSKRGQEPAMNWLSSFPRNAKDCSPPRTSANRPGCYGFRVVYLATPQK
jgi:hypothetical protein